MLDVTFTDSVTVRRAKAGSRTVSNSVQYDELKDEGGFPLPIRCRIERRKRRIHNVEGAELDADATLVYRKDKAPQLQIEDLIFTKRKEVFRVLTLEEANLLFCGKAVYGRLALQFSRQTVPGDLVV